MKTTKISSASGLVQALGLESSQPLAIVGSGGKTTILFRLAQHWTTRGLSPLVTTTTQMFKPIQTEQLRVGQYGEHVISDQGVQFLYRECLVPEAQESPAKVLGLTSSQVMQLQREFPGRPLLYEADGSRHMPLKIHAPHEPVVADRNHFVLLVAGLSTWGQPITPHTCHRLSLQPQFQGEIVDQSSLTRLLQLAVEQCQPNAIILNQADLLPAELSATALCYQLSQQLERKVVTSTWL